MLYIVALDTIVAERSGGDAVKVLKSPDFGKFNEFRAPKPLLAEWDRLPGSRGAA